MSHPVRDQADLRIGEVGDHVTREAAPGELAAQRQKQGGADDEPRPPRAPGHQSGDHGAFPSSFAARMPRRRSASMKKVALATTRSCACNPDSTTANPCFRNVSPIWI